MFSDINKPAKPKHKQMDTRLAQNSLNPGKMLCAKVHRPQSRFIPIKFSRNPPTMKMAFIIDDENGYQRDDSTNSTQAKAGGDERRLPSLPMEI